MLNHILGLNNSTVIQDIIVDDDDDDDRRLAVATLAIVLTFQSGRKSRVNRAVGRGARSNAISYRERLALAN
jgi:hypothetical protein